MTIRRGLLVLIAGVGVTAAAAGTAVASTAVANTTVAGSPAGSTTVLPVAAAPAAASVLDGIAFGYLPTRLGRASDFEYGLDGVDFVSRVWESGSDEAGWRVDLDIEVLRGDRLSSARALHDWFIRYQDRPAAEAQYTLVRVNGHPGWLCRDQLFWLLRPGLAASVQLDRNRWARAEVVRIADAAHQV